MLWGLHSKENHTIRNSELDINTSLKNDIDTAKINFIYFK